MSGLAIWDPNLSDASDSEQASLGSDANTLHDPL